MGFDPLCYDPPRSARDPGFSGISSLPWSDIDVLCVHAALTREGPFPSFHYLSRTVLSQLKPGSLVIHAARGDIVAPGAWQANPHVHFIADVFPNEPHIDPVDIASALLATPHIAGYSQLAKWRGTAQVMAGFNACFGLAVPLPALKNTEPNVFLAPSFWPQIEERLAHLAALSKAFKVGASSSGALPDLFRSLRRDYPFREALPRRVLG
jgi:phosphoglycerate dehydrogenase-like enzyme